jgi:hypothetical protein
MSLVPRYVRHDSVGNPMSAEDYISELEGRLAFLLSHTPTEDGVFVFPDGMTMEASSQAPKRLQCTTPTDGLALVGRLMMAVLPHEPKQSALTQSALTRQELAWLCGILRAIKEGRMFEYRCASGCQAG